MKKYLALDIGTKRIGVAGTDALGMTVQPLDVVTRKASDVDAARICGIARERNVDVIVAGLPLRGEGEVGIQAKKVRVFLEQLRKAIATQGLPIEIVEWDESMTTHDAEEKLREAGVRRVRRVQMIDAMAAVMILESYLRGQGA